MIGYISVRHAPDHLWRVTSCHGAPNTPTSFKMTGSCQYCASKRVVPVLYERMDRADWKAGNKYRPFCYECEKWNPCCSKEVWQTHESPKVLPADSDPDDPDLIPAEETRFADNLANVFECPNDGCKAVHAGYPTECDNCGAPYRWK